MTTERTRTVPSRTLEQARCRRRRPSYVRYIRRRLRRRAEGPIRPMYGHCDLGGKRLTLETGTRRRRCPSLIRLRFESAVNHPGTAVAAGRIGIEMRSQQLHRRRNDTARGQTRPHARTNPLALPKHTHAHARTHTRTGNLTAVSSSLTTGRKRLRNEQSFRTRSRQK
jgi:hypothetical protein